MQNSNDSRQEPDIFNAENRENAVHAEAKASVSFNSIINSLINRSKKAHLQYNLNKIYLSLTAIFSIIILLAIVIGAEGYIRMWLETRKSAKAQARVDELKKAAAESAASLDFAEKSFSEAERKMKETETTVKLKMVEEKETQKELTGIEEQVQHIKDGRLNSVWFNQEASEGWAVGRSGTRTRHQQLILQYKNGKWQNENLLEQGSLSSVWFNQEASEGWAVGSFGPELAVTQLIRHYKNGEWIKKDPVQFGRLESVWFNQELTEGWAVGADGTFGNHRQLILHYKNGRWQSEGPSESGSLSSVWFNQESTKGWTVGSQKTMLNKTNGEWISIKYAEPTEIELGKRVKDIKALVIEKEKDLKKAQEERQKAIDDFNKNSAVVTSAKKNKELSEAQYEGAMKAAEAIPEPPKDTVQQSITRGGAIAGAVGMAIFLMQIFLSSMRYYARLAEFYEAQSDALKAANGDQDLTLALLEKLSPIGIEFGAIPKHIYGKVLDTINEVAKGKKFG